MAEGASKQTEKSRRSFTPARARARSRGVGTNFTARNFQSRRAAIRTMRNT
ncbi:hypothetical protein [Chryseobacterium sp. SIMBA_028]|uniref:hypothetical protein n=1 Tax=Chryseobacterium sp. SIMBA_028 TaxID=3085771 RepID=UPI00397A93C1